MYDAYIGVLEQVERNMLGEDEKSITMIRCDYSYTELLKRLWRKGTFRYCFALDSSTGLHHIFYHHIRPRYQSPYGKSQKSKFDTEFYLATSTFLCLNAWDFAESKVKDKEKYDEQLRLTF
ncbi:hypothetical protein I7I51_03338 [Histoplasma capsulatum]|uniref:Uncharacterized protein n=1 Tax=Ajellomyces capsulatus TaxID=5037 RepID=A0A8A1M3S2_AJECA|nr:hypothetical protein I7I51_03338 [Histoplasma capsulatum]